MYFILFCTLIFALSEAKQTSVELPPKVIQILEEKSPGCIAKTGADSEILQRVYKWEFEDNESDKDYYMCMFNELQLIDNAGHFILEKVPIMFENSDRKEVVTKVTEECNKIVAKNAPDTLLAVIKCFYVNSPVLLHVKDE